MKKSIIIDSEMTSTKDYGQVYQIGILNVNNGNKKEWTFRPYTLKVVAEKASKGNVAGMLNNLARGKGDSELIEIMRRQKVIDKNNKIHPKKLYQPQACSFRYDERKFPDDVTFGNCKNDILKELKEADEIIGYNISADYRRISYTASLINKNYEFENAMKNKLHDIMPEFSKFAGYDNIKFSLQEAIKIMGIEFRQEHHALSDCEITLQLMNKMEHEKTPSYEKIIDSLNDILNDKRAEKVGYLSKDTRKFRDIYFAGMCESNIKKLQRKIQSITEKHYGIERTYSPVPYEDLYGPEGDGAPMGMPDDIFDECSRIKGVTYERACSEYFKLADEKNWDISKYITENVPKIRDILYDWNGIKNNSLVIKTIMHSKGTDVNDYEIRAAQFLDEHEIENTKSKKNDHKKNKIKSAELDYDLKF